MIKILYLIILSFLCSCTTYHHEKGRVDIEKIRNSQEKYGVILFRPIFFKDLNMAQNFLNDEFSLNLSYENEMWIDAKDYLGKNSYNIGRSEPFTHEEREREFRFAKVHKVTRGIERIAPPFTYEEQKNESRFTKAKVGSFDTLYYYPEFFYSVKMLPEGEYYISYIRYYRGYYSGSLVQSFNYKNSVYRFYVKANKINYLGDLYFMSPSESNGFFSGTYTIQQTLLDISDKAKLFVAK